MRHLHRSWTFTCCSRQFGSSSVIRRLALSSLRVPGAVLKPDFVTRCSQASAQQSSRAQPTRCHIQQPSRHLRRCCQCPYCGRPRGASAALRIALEEAFASVLACGTPLRCFEALPPCCSTQKGYLRSAVALARHQRLCRHPIKSRSLSRQQWRPRETLPTPSRTVPHAGIRVPPVLSQHWLRSRHAVNVAGEVSTDSLCPHAQLVCVCDCKRSPHRLPVATRLDPRFRFSPKQRWDRLPQRCLVAPGRQPSSEVDPLPAWLQSSRAPSLHSCVAAADTPHLVSPTRLSIPKKPTLNWTYRHMLSQVVFVAQSILV